MKSARFVRFTALALLVLARLAFAQGGEPLTNQDIVKMVRAELSESIVLSTIESAGAVKFDLSPEALIALKTAGVGDRLILAMQARAAGPKPVEAPAPPPALAFPEKSEALAASKGAEAILRDFRTMLVDASAAQFFKSDQMKAALQKNKDFDDLRITVVDDPSLADVVLEVGYTFAWDYPFSLKHQNTSVVLVSGKGSGPFSGPAGATSVAKELIKLLKPYRAPARPVAPKR